jgi:hypothetical protein
MSCAQQIADLLVEKDDLDRARMQANNMVSFTSWLVDGVELLLRAELERQSDGHGATDRGNAEAQGRA